MTAGQMKAQGVADAYAFAIKAIAETQGVYNRGNRPDWAHGALGSVLMTFKQYSVAYVEFLKRLPPKERLLALAILTVAAGANGLPFGDDLDDITDTIGQALGYNMNIKKTKDRILAGALGQGAADFILNGFSGPGGLPLDVSMRMGMGNLLPMTGLLKQSEQHKENQYAEILGAAGGFGKKLVEGANKAMGGDVAGTLTSVVPTALTNVAKAMDMVQSGAYRDTKGRKVIDTDIVDAVTKAIGFQPAEVAREQKQLAMVRQDIDLANTVKQRIADQWAQAVYAKDSRAATTARAAIADWNEKNPETKIGVNMTDVLKRVRSMRLDKVERVVKQAPKTMRQSVRDALE